MHDIKLKRFLEIRYIPLELVASATQSLAKQFEKHITSQLGKTKIKK